MAGEVCYPRSEQLALAGGILLGQPRRIVALREENRMVMLRTSEVTVAEADGTGVWLHTDDGRLRAAVSGLDKLDTDLAGTGSFLRVHRQYLVNLSRVREVERREKGELVLVMDDPKNTMVPVSRRNVRPVRDALSI
jgi:sigma-54 dependent transcriptional regulator, acetoin dehydrogenase operon transcriptional activator AcoR